jgi:hypothetical protein
MKISVYPSVSALWLLLMSALVMAVYEAPLEDEPQTMALWNMDSTATLSDGKVIVFDQDTNWTRSNRHLTMYDGDTSNGWGVTLVDSMAGFGKAGQFDGVNDYGRSFTPMPITEEFKIEFWVKPDSSKGDLNWVAEIPQSWRIYIDTNATRMKMFVKDANGDWSSQLTIAITPDAWSHITAGFENGVAYLGKDFSTQYAQTTLPTSAIFDAGASNYLYVGCMGGTQRFLKGQIDDVRLSNPNAEIPDWMTVYEDTVVGTYGLYHFDEFNGSIIEDDNSADINRNPLDLTAYGSPELVSDGDYPKGIADFGSSMSFDGISDYFRCEVMPPYDIDTSNFRIEVWVKMNPDWYTISGGLFWIAAQDSMFRVYLESMSGTVGSTRLRFYVWPSDGQEAVLTNAGVGELAGWNHIACEFNNGVAKSYLNNVEIASSTLTPTAQVASQKLVVGSYDGSSRMFWGQMDELRISSAVMPEPQCGDFGYLAADLDKNCVVDIADLKILLEDWLKCTADEPGCESTF